MKIAPHQDGKVLSRRKTLSNHRLNKTALDSEIQSKTHSFILKLWLEEFDRKGKGAVWRGHITHVTNGKRRYVQHIIEIVNFIVPYLEEMGVKVYLPWRFIQRLLHPRTPLRDRTGTGDEPRD